MGFVGVQEQINSLSIISYWENSLGIKLFAIRTASWNEFNSDSGGTTVLVYSELLYFYFSKKELVYIPTRYRPSGRTFALGPPCGRLAGTLRLPCVCLENSMATAGTP